MDTLDLKQHIRIQIKGQSLYYVMPERKKPRLIGRFFTNNIVLFQQALVLRRDELGFPLTLVRFMSYLAREMDSNVTLAISGTRPLLQCMNINLYARREPDDRYRTVLWVPSMAIFNYNKLIELSSPRVGKRRLALIGAQVTWPPSLDYEYKYFRDMIASLKQ